MDWLGEHPESIYVLLAPIGVLSGGTIYLGERTEKADALQRQAEAYDKQGQPYAGLLRDTITVSWQADVMDTDRPVPVDFWTTYCMSCRNYEPVLVGFAKQMGDKARFLKVERDEGRPFSDRCGITLIPDLVLFKRGKEVTRFIGGQPPEVIQRALENAAL